MRQLLLILLLHGIVEFGLLVIQVYGFIRLNRVILVGFLQIPFGLLQIPLLQIPFFGSLLILLRVFTLIAKDSHLFFWFIIGTSIIFIALLRLWLSI